MLASLLTLLRGGQSREIVWTADITYWLAGQRQAGRADPAWDTEEGFLRLHRDLGILPYYEYSHFWAGEARYDATVETRNETVGNTTRRYFQTPKGELYEESVFLPDSCCHGCTRHFVQTPGDVEILRYLLEHRHWETENLRDYPQRAARWAVFDGLPPVGMPRSPLPALAYEWTGMQNLVYLLMDCSRQVHELLQVMEAQERPVLDAVCRLAPPLVHFPDNLSSENFTGFFDEFMGDGYRKRLTRLHGIGSRCAVHLDGTVRGLLPKLATAGLDAVEAITPQPAGDLSLKEIRACAANKQTILWGGVPGVMFASPYDWTDMRKHIEKLLRCWAGQPFIIGVGDQVPPDGDIDFCRRIADLLKKRADRTG